MTYVLGISDSHNATSCLLLDGKIVACASEERFSRQKNYWGFPSQAIGYCLREGGIRGDQLSLVVLATNYLVMTRGVNYSKAFSNLYGLLSTAAYIASPWRGLYARAYNSLAPALSRKTRRIRIKQASTLLGIEEERIVTMDHHLAHAFTGAFSSGFDEAVILTNDGMGDSLCATVSIKKGNEIKTVSRTHFTNSLAALYFTVTNYLGLKGLEDEHKVMGLAPYAKDPRNSRIYEVLNSQFRINDDLTIKARVPTHHYDQFINKCCFRARFDQIAAAIQLITEETLVCWVSKALARYKMRHVVLSGGTFLNVKSNMRIAELGDIERLFVMPSAADESNAIGATYWGYLSQKPEAKINPIGDLYLGPSYGEQFLRQFLETRARKEYAFEHLSDVADTIGELLSKGKIVGRYNGRMEFGARALGNRSILARADDSGIVNALNSRIKSRDFWMPFSPTILSESADHYLGSPPHGRVNPEYMAVAFHGTEAAHEDLVAATHVYDRTVRPQVLYKEWNPEFAETLYSFKERTGIAGLVNTSFNLHGEPIVESPEDALSTFERSGLEYLAMGNFLLYKKA